MHFRKTILYRSIQTSKTILEAALKVNGGGFRKILRRTAYFSYFVIQPQNLGQNLIIKYEIIGVSFQWQLLQKLP